MDKCDKAIRLSIVRTEPYTDNLPEPIEAWVFWANGDPFSLFYEEVLVKLYRDMGI